MFAISTFVLGFMLAILFQTTKQPVERDTRSIWELREDLEKEKKQQMLLNDEVGQYELLLNQYEQNSENNRIKAIEEALYNLQVEAGLTPRQGRGVVLTIEPLFDEELLGEEVPILTPELLLRLINQLNIYGTESLEVGDQRMITTSAIREVNGETYVNNRPLGNLPVQIKVIAEDATRLYDQIKGSKVLDDFANENLTIIPELKNQVELVPYDHHLSIKYMTQFKEDS